MRLQSKYRPFSFLAELAFPPRLRPRRSLPIMAGAAATAFATSLAHSASPSLSRSRSHASPSPSPSQSSSSSLSSAASSPRRARSPSLSGDTDDLMSDDDTLGVHNNWGFDSRGMETVRCEWGGEGACGMEWWEVEPLVEHVHSGTFSFLLSVLPWFPFLLFHLSSGRSFIGTASSSLSLTPTVFSQSTPSRTIPTAPPVQVKGRKARRRTTSAIGRGAREGGRRRGASLRWWHI